MLIVCLLTHGFARSAPVLHSIALRLHGSSVHGATLVPPITIPIHHHDLAKAPELTPAATLLARKDELPEPVKQAETLEPETATKVEDADADADLHHPPHELHHPT